MPSWPSTWSAQSAMARPRGSRRAWRATWRPRAPVRCRVVGPRQFATLVFFSPRRHQGLDKPAPARACRAADASARADDDDADAGRAPHAAPTAGRRASAGHDASERVWRAPDWSDAWDANARHGAAACHVRTAAASHGGRASGHGRRHGRLAISAIAHAIAGVSSVPGVPAVRGVPAVQATSWTGVAARLPATGLTARSDGDVPALGARAAATL